VPDPAQIDDPLKRAAIERALQYMQLKPNTLLADVPVQRVFIGSCTNSRIEDLRAAAAIAKGRKVADGVVALVVPGSGHVKHQAEEEGLDRVFLEAGFQWRDAGCSMCMSMNDDKAMNGERVATTSNRNFEGRQGKNAKSHLMGPAMAAAAAVTVLDGEVDTVGANVSVAEQPVITDAAARTATVPDIRGRDGRDRTRPIYATLATVMQRTRFWECCRP